jgi:aminopeptidase N
MLLSFPCRKLGSILIVLLVQSMVAEGIPLTQQEAEKRASAIRNPSYELRIELDPNKTDFHGSVSVSFALRQSASTFLDFAEGKVKSVQANGEKISVRHKNGRIEIPENKLRSGTNRITVDFSVPFSTNGTGLYKFKDPEDGEFYVYTDFEPYDANRLFPCFDQPDLKAKYHLTVKAPSSWTVITYDAPKTIPIKTSAFAEWDFPESKEFSTYIFSLHAGPYHSWTDDAAKIPSRLFARKSMAKYVKPTEWFTPTRQGFAFFQNYFDIPYPFAKYDQVIVPDFNSGAMENVAAVTFSESFISKGQETNEDRENRAEVILHEMAHMWFGNLVTMKWWDDLWLNESFATFMASKALFDATEFKTAWRTFYQDMKQWAYWEDQLVTTHPILADIANTADAFNNFDGITYGKGAAVLKQLDFFVGSETFRNGVRTYLKDHSFGNATLIDFMKAQSVSAKLDLQAWGDEWLKTSSLNSIRVEFSCDAKGKIDSFKLMQESGEGKPLLRNHRANISTYGKDDSGKIVELRMVSVNYSTKEKSVPELVSEVCPLFVYPNARDMDYVRVNLDSKSIAAIKGNLSAIGDEFTRTMVWQSLWDMVRDAQLTAEEYSEIALSQLGTESDARIILSVLNNIHGEYASSRSSVVGYMPQSSDGEKKRYAAVMTRWEDYLNNKLTASVAGSDLQRIWFESLVRLSISTARQSWLESVLDGKTTVAGLELDQDLRWVMIRELSSRGRADMAKRIKEELKKDTSSRGRQSGLGAEAAHPDLKQKEAMVKTHLRATKGSTLAEQRSVIWNLFPNHQVGMHVNFEKEFFKTLPALSKSKEGKFLEAYVSSFSPAACDVKSSRASREFLRAQGASLHPTVKKELLVAAQESDRCAKAFEFARAQGETKLKNN